MNLTINERYFFGLRLPSGYTPMPHNHPSEHDAVARAECRILKALEAGPLSVTQLASRTGISRMTVHRRLSSLRVDKMVAVKPGNGCVPDLWRLA